MCAYDDLLSARADRNDDVPAFRAWLRPNGLCDRKRFNRESDLSRPQHFGERVRSSFICVSGSEGAHFVNEANQSEAGALVWSRARLTIKRIQDMDPPMVDAGSISHVQPASFRTAGTHKAEGCRATIRRRMGYRAKIGCNFSSTPSLLIGGQLEVVQTQVCRDQEEVLTTGEQWKAALAEEGWR